jgi:hypothetical protein
MINLQWGFNPIIIRMLFTVTLFQQFVGYSESWKTYQIYMPSQRQIEVSRDVSFEEEVAFRRSRGSHMEIDSERQEEMVSSPPHPSTVQREPIEPMETVEPVDHVDPVDVP